MLQSQIPPNFDQDIKQFETDISDFKIGNLHETAFTAKRVKMGVYQERGAETYMCRIRCAGNILTPDQLAKIGNIARVYGLPFVHITTRAEIQIHKVELSNIITVIKELRSIGLSMKGSGGHTVRNILTNHDSGIHPDDIFDVQAFAIALTNRLMAEPDSFELPRKLKISFSSREDTDVFASLHDIGFIAQINDEQEAGFQVYVGGGLGLKPKIGVLLHKFIPQNKVFHVVRAIKNVFHTYGNRRNKHHSRIRFLIHDDLGEKQFKAYYEAELKKIYNDKSLELSVHPIDNQNNMERKIDSEPIIDDTQGYETWYKRYVQTQEQDGLCSILLPLNLGDLTSNDCMLLSQILKAFGENTLRCTPDQNLAIRNIPVHFLNTIYSQIKKLDTLTDTPNFYSNIVPCTGAQTCQIGLLFPRPATDKIFSYLNNQGLDMEAVKDIKVRISGCPNSCAAHWVADLGFFGKIRRVEDRLIPTYNVLGGTVIKAGETNLAQEVGWVHSYNLPEFIKDVLANFINYKNQIKAEINFSQYWQNSGREFIQNLCLNQFNDIPSFAEDKNYYFDQGATEIFAIKNMGIAECAAGIYDMIDVDYKEIKKNLKQIKSWENKRKGIGLVLKITVFSAARMLLVTRGEEPRTEKETYDLFVKHFIDTGLIEKKHQFIIELVRDEKFCELPDHKQKVVTLSEDLIELFKSMDNTMHFPGDKKVLLTSESESDSDSDSIVDDPIAKNNKSVNNNNALIDLRGVKCPINFVKTKIALSTMKSGERLEVYLDDGEPIKNVPGSVKAEGHHILLQERKESYWSVVIEKI